MVKNIIYIRSTSFTIVKELFGVFILSNYFEELLLKGTITEQLRFGDRIEFLIEKRGISKNWLAQKMGISKQALNYLIKHSTKAKYIDSIAEILSANPSWIEFGTGDPFFIEADLQKAQVSKLRVYDSNATLFTLKEKHQDIGQEFIEFKDMPISNYIAYLISDDSLFPPFIDGSVLIFDKKKPPSNGDYVLLAIGDRQSLIARKYSKDGDSICFQSNNPNYQSLNGVDAVILGVLIEARYQLH